MMTLVFFKSHCSLVRTVLVRVAVRRNFFERVFSILLDGDCSARLYFLLDLDLAAIFVRRDELTLNEANVDYGGFLSAIVVA